MASAFFWPISTTSFFPRVIPCRVGIDSTEQYGGWNAPVDTRNWRFVFVPITDTSYNGSGYVEGGKNGYGDEVTATLCRFGRECGHPESNSFRLLARLYNEPPSTSIPILVA